MIINKFVDKETDESIKIKATGDVIEIFIDNKLRSKWFNCDSKNLLISAKTLDEVYNILTDYMEI